jgi:hypothetical protein
MFQSHQAPRYILPGIISFLGAFFLTLETYLNQIGKSLCHTSACKIVGKYILLPESLLIALAAAFFWLLTLSFYYGRSQPKHFSNLPLFLLTPALIFDASLIGYQFFTIEKFCLICFFTAGLLLVILFTCMLSRTTWQLLVILLLAWLGAFGSQSIIQMPEPGNAYSEMLFFREAVKNNRDANNIQTVTLVFSMECPHCLKLIDFLSKHQISSTRFQLASIDQSPDALRKIALFLQKAPQEQNIFKSLLESKNAVTAPSNHNVHIIKKANKKALAFLSNIGIYTIPVIIINTSQNEKHIFTSGESAINYFIKQKKINEPSS